MAAPEDELCAALTRLALAGDGLVLGISMTVLAIRTWMKFWTHSKALKDIKETPMTRIADLRTLVNETDVEPTEKFHREIPDKVINLRLVTFNMLFVATNMWLRCKLFSGSKCLLRLSAAVCVSQSGALMMAKRELVV